MNHATRFAKLALLLALVGALALGGCGGGDDGLSAAEQARINKAEADLQKAEADLQAEEDRLADIQAAMQAIAAAETAAAAQAAYDAVKDDATATEGAGLQTAVDTRIAALAKVDRVAAQKTALMTAAGSVDVSTFDLTTAEGIAAADTAITALKEALAAAVDVSDADKVIYQLQLNAAEAPVMAEKGRLAAIQAAMEAEEARLAAIKAAMEAITMAETAAAAQAAYDAVKDAATATEGDGLQAAVKMRSDELATMGRIAEQKMALTTAAGNVDVGTFDLTTEEGIAAANTAITALKEALAAAVDVSDADKDMYQLQLNAAEAPVMAAQAAANRMARIEAARQDIAMAETAAAAQAAYDAVKDEATDTEGAELQAEVDMRIAALATMGRAAAQKMALTTAAGNVDVSTFDLTTTEGIAAADTVISALKAALANAVDVSEADKAIYQQRLDLAEAPVMAEKGRLAAIQAARQDIAVAETAAAAQAAYDAVKDEATATEGAGLQAAVDTRIAALATMDRVAAQKMALTTAAGNVDTSGLTTAEDIAAANTAITALKAALAAAVDVSAADKAMYQSTVAAAETAVTEAQGDIDHAAQLMALMTAAGNVDVSTFDLATPEGIAAADTAINALRAALAAAVDVSEDDKAIYQLELGLAEAPVMAEKDRLAAIQAARQDIAVAETAADAQAAYDAVKDDATATEGAGLQTAVDTRIAALATMDRVAAQKTELMTAAGNVDTSGLMTAEDIVAANMDITALKAALAAAVDVSDADKAMYQARVDAAETAVMTAQSVIAHDAQMMELTEAVTGVADIDLSDLTTQEKINAANAAIARLRAALEAATELSDAEKSAARIELATANRTVMVVVDRANIEGQKMMLSDAVDALGAIDLNDLMTQAQIDAAEAAIIALDLALVAAADLTDAQKLDATVDVTFAKRKVTAAQGVLASNIEGQRMALSDAVDALGEIDLDDLSDEEKIDEAQAAVDALKAALGGATHLSENDKATYQTQLDEATETVRTAQTGMDLDGRMAAQRAALTNAMDMARAAVGMVNDDVTDAQVTAADNAITALETAIAGAEDLPEGDADVATAGGTLTTLTGLLDIAKTSRTAAMDDQAMEDRKAMAELGKAMHAALGAPAGMTALDNLLLADLSAAGLVITSNAAPAFPVELEAGDSAGALGSWNGMNYAHTDSGTKVTNTAVVYTNKGPGKMVSFADKSATDSNFEILASGNDKGYVLLDASDSDVLGRIMGADFTHSGTELHEPAPREDEVYFRGTYAGEPGEYRCTPLVGTIPCTSTNDGKGSPSVLEGLSWHFKPDAGANAMTHEPDANYLYFGWWLSKDKDGMPTVASAFTGAFGELTEVFFVSSESPVTSITGSATYSGKAAGQFALSNSLDATGDAGHFTADAMLTAKFGPVIAPNNAGVTGTINNFMANDKSVPWSVKLNRAIWTNTATAQSPVYDQSFESAADTSNSVAEGTVWSIDGNSAPESGVWKGQMYDEMSAGTEAQDFGDNDGSNIPTTVTGTFYSEFGSIGRMIGAFGADKQ